jgi:hypothetical protein
MAPVGPEAMTADSARSTWRRAVRALAVVLFCSAAVVGIGVIVMSVALHQQGIGEVGSSAIDLTCALVGIVIAWHQPRHPMGWILLGVACFFSLDNVAGGYVMLDYTDHHGTWPLGAVALVADQSWAPAIALFGLAFLVYPDGTAAASRWRWVVRAYLVLGAAWTAGAWALAIAAAAGHDIHISGGGSLTTGQNSAWWTLLDGAFFVGMGAAWLSWLTYQVVIWRRSSGERRQQMKWLMAGAAACAVFGVLTVTLENNRSALLSDVGYLAAAGLAALPLSIGVGILKFRLYDIDRIISRTLAYAIITGLLVGVYAGLILLATQVLKFHSTVAVAASTLVAAALFNPVRRRVQHAVDRRFNRARYDAEQMVAAFAARLQDAVDHDAVRADLTGMVHTALAPTHVSVWLRPGERH